MIPAYVYLCLCWTIMRPSIHPRLLCKTSHLSGVRSGRSITWTGHLHAFNAYGYVGWCSVCPRPWLAGLRTRTGHDHLQHQGTGSLPWLADIVPLESCIPGDASSCCKSPAAAQSGLLVKHIMKVDPSTCASSPVPRTGFRTSSKYPPYSVSVQPCVEQDNGSGLRCLSCALCTSNTVTRLGHSATCTCPGVMH